MPCHTQTPSASAVNIPVLALRRLPSVRAATAQNRHCCCVRQHRPNQSDRPMHERKALRYVVVRLNRRCDTLKAPEILRVRARSNHGKGLNVSLLTWNQFIFNVCGAEKGASTAVSPARYVWERKRVVGSANHATSAKHVLYERAESVSLTSMFYGFGLYRSRRKTYFLTVAPHLVAHANTVPFYKEPLAGKKQKRPRRQLRPTWVPCPTPVPRPPPFLPAVTGPRWGRAEQKERGQRWRITGPEPNHSRASARTRPPRG